MYKQGRCEKPVTPRFIAEQADRGASRPRSKQTAEQADRGANRPRSKQTTEQADRGASKSRSKQTTEQADRGASRPRSKQTTEQADHGASRPRSKQTAELVNHRAAYLRHMKMVIQRVSQANVKIDNEVKGEIDKGLLVLVGFQSEDSSEDLDWSAHKLVNLRIFSDSEDKMNLSLLDISGEILLISQFTLHANTKKGFRPSFIQAAKPDIAIPLYNQFVALVQSKINTQVQTGEFGADMKVSLTNDGPVTIVIDSKNK